MSDEAEEAARIFAYDQMTGNLVWRERNGDAWFNSRFTGRVAGTKTAMGYTSVRFRGRQHLVHRVVWLIHNGAWPAGQIDHRDGVKDNNRIENLRDVTPAINAQNKPQRKGQSGVKGVHWSKRQNAWQARVGRLHLGYYPTVAMAAAVIANSDLTELPPHLSKPKMPTPSHGDVLRAIRYEPLTGQFFFRSADGSERPAGSMSHGYVRIQVRGRRFHAQRLAVFYMTGAWPEGVVDHVNGQRDDNRWENLRAVSPTVNALNRRYADEDRGIRPTRNKTAKWEAEISVNRKRYFLGSFPTKEAAQASWQAAYDYHLNLSLTETITKKQLPNGP